jgi:hypothetical protein
MPTGTRTRIRCHTRMAGIRCGGRARPCFSGRSHDKFLPEHDCGATHEIGLRRFCLEIWYYILK